MGKLIDMTGWVMKEHGVKNSKITVIKRDKENNSHGAHWICECECGNKFSARGDSLREGRVISCGCASFTDMMGWKMSEHGVPDSKWTVLELTIPPEGVKGRTYWLCECECGTKKKVAASILKNGDSKSCGCYAGKDMTGWLLKEHGQPNSWLTVLKKVPDPNKGKKVYYLCECECGNTVIYSGETLRKGRTFTCGCHKRNYTPIKVGDVYHKIKFLEPTEKRSGNAIIWKCECLYCHKIFEGNGSLLRNGMKRCECQSNLSRGESLIREILIDNNLPFEREKTFETCKFSDTGKKARFDFYVDNKYLIEFDGSHHFEPRAWSKLDDANEKFKKTQEHDNYKNDWCKKNNIPLIRIPYIHYSNLCIEDLLLETSQFII